MGMNPCTGSPVLMSHLHVKLQPIVQINNYTFQENYYVQC